jgi:hypothetical protein
MLARSIFARLFAGKNSAVKQQRMTLRGLRALLTDHLGQGVRSTLTLDPSLRIEPEQLFPDPSLRMDPEHPSALFDPFNLRLSLEEPLPFSDARGRLMRGEVEEVKKNVLPEFWLKNGPQRLAFILDLTSGVHELRHYHDHFGTTFGFHRILRTIEDAIEFNRVWDSLKKEPKIRLPLGKWGRSADAPIILREYLRKRREYVEWFALADHATGPLKLGPAPSRVGLVFDLHGRTAVVPTVTVNLRNADIALADAHEQKSVPLGGRALLEGSALATQQIIINWVFGRSTLHQFNEFVSHGSPDDDRWLDYWAIRAYLSERVGQRSEWAQLAFSDLAMMGEHPEDLLHEHPGVRISDVVTAALAGAPIYRQYGVNLAAYLDQLTAHLKWKPVRVVARAAVAKANRRIKQLNALAERNTMWPRILHAVYSLHRDFMQIRVKQPDFLVNPRIYTDLLRHHCLPRPPILQEGRSLIFQGPDDADALAFRQWFFFEHFQRHLLSGTALPCAGGQVNHRCPGDALQRGWAPLETCLFSQFVEMTGVPQLDLVKA